MPVLLAFFGGAITKVIAFFTAKWAAGAIKTTFIYSGLLVGLGTLIFSIADYVNNILLGLINNIPSPLMGTATSILAFMPTNLPYLVSIILGYYLFSGGVHLAIELLKLKAKWTEKAFNTK